MYPQFARLAGDEISKVVTGNASRGDNYYIMDQNYLKNNPLLNITLHLLKANLIL